MNFSSIAPGLESTESREIGWAFAFTLGAVSYFVFSSPFASNRELRNRWPIYLYLIMFVHGLIALSVLVHIPISARWTPSRLQIPHAYFALCLVLTILVMIVFDGLFRPARSKLAYFNGFRRSVAENIVSSVFVAALATLVYARCQAAAPHDEAPPDGLCGRMGEPELYAPLGVLVAPDWKLWVTCVSIMMINSAMERTSDLRGIFTPVRADQGTGSVPDGRAATTHALLYQASRLREGGGESGGGDGLGAGGAAGPFAPAAGATGAAPPGTHGDDGAVVVVEERPADTLGMVPWYSLMTSFSCMDFLIWGKLFLGRIDARAEQAVLMRGRRRTPDGMHAAGYWDALAARDELWVDFMADCGDGFDSSYAVARLMAQPEIVARDPQTGAEARLPRADVALIGGDLAYPSPSQFSYERRFFRVFEDAMPPPPDYDPAALSTSKPDLPAGMPLRRYGGPLAFAIPGNHDHFDGGAAFARYLQCRDWLGGWLLPQDTSYWALKLPHGWWVLGMDTGLEDDIDVGQYRYFAHVAEHMARADRAIVITHAPSWVIEPYERRRTEHNLRYLLDTVLQGRVALRLAGDVHNYTRHIPLAAKSARVSHAAAPPPAPPIGAQDAQPVPIKTAVLRRSQTVDAVGAAAAAATAAAAAQATRHMVRRQRVTPVATPWAAAAQEAAWPRAPAPAAAAAAVAAASSTAGSARQSFTQAEAGLGWDHGRFVLPHSSGRARARAPHGTRTSGAAAAAAIPTVDAAAAAAATAAAVDGCAQLRRSEHAAARPGRRTRGRGAAAGGGRSRPALPRSWSGGFGTGLDAVFRHDAVPVTADGGLVPESFCAPGRGPVPRRRRSQPSEADDLSAHRRPRARARRSPGPLAHGAVANRSTVLPLHAPTEAPRSSTSTLSLPRTSSSPSTRSASTSGSPSGSSWESSSTASDSDEAPSQRRGRGGDSRVRGESKPARWLRDRSDGDGLLSRELPADASAKEVDRLRWEIRHRREQERVRARHERTQQHRRRRRCRRRRRRQRRRSHRNQPDPQDSGQHGREFSGRRREEGGAGFTRSSVEPRHVKARPGEDAFAGWDRVVADGSGLSLGGAPGQPAQERAHARTSPMQATDGYLSDPQAPLGRRGKEHGGKGGDAVCRPPAVPRRNASLGSISSLSSVASTATRMARDLQGAVHSLATRAAPSPESQLSGGARAAAAEPLPSPNRRSRFATAATTMRRGEHRGAPPDSGHALAAGSDERASTPSAFDFPAGDGPLPDGRGEAASPDSSASPPSTQAGTGGGATGAGADTGSRYPVLVVSGGGGAFLHPTNMGVERIDVDGIAYRQTHAYPPQSTCRRLAALNLVQFRRRNWQFDILGALFYYLLVVSLFPVCDIRSEIAGAGTWVEFATRFATAVPVGMAQVVETSHVSLVMLLLAFGAFYLLAESALSTPARVAVGALHTLAHFFCAVALALALELLIATCVHEKLLGQTELHALFTAAAEAVPAVGALVSILDSLTFGGVSWLLRWTLSVSDVPNAVAVLRSELCAMGPAYSASVGVSSASAALTAAPCTCPAAAGAAKAAATSAAVLGMQRTHRIVYYMMMLVLYWVVATPVAAFVLGAYLYISCAGFNMHFNEAFSSLRIQDWKNFVRLHVTRGGDLEVHVVGLDRVPRRWKRDGRWSGTRGHRFLDPGKPSYAWSRPSKWVPDDRRASLPRIVDSFVIKATRPRSERRYSF